MGGGEGAGGNGVCRGCALRGNEQSQWGRKWELGLFRVTVTGCVMVIWGHSYWGSGCLGVTVISDLILGVTVIRIWGY